MNSISSTIKQAFDLLTKFGERVPQKTWQNVPSPDDTWEITNAFLGMRMPEEQVNLALETGANLPWAEAHFQERVGGLPLNPGEQWMNWPFYKHGDDDKRFRQTGQFSHSYMERFWCKFKYEDIFKGAGMIRKGIRFDYGDYHDIVERAREDKGSRQLYLSIWHPEDQSNGNGRVPCTLGYFFLIRNHTLDVTYHIRSCDILRHFRNDIYMAVRLAQDFRDKVDPTINLGKLNMWVGSLHCFINEKEILKKYTK